MQNSFMILPQEFYQKHLSNIHHIHFTQREIDVISCILNGKKTKKIALILDINSRTIETHIRNIMLKIECNSQESIIDFIENSDKIDLLRDYYSLLKNESLFKKSLSETSKLIPHKTPSVFLTSDEDKHPVVIHLFLHLKLAGISLLNASRKKKADYVIFAFLNSSINEDIILRQKLNPTSQRILFLQSEEQLSISKIKSEWKIIYPTNNQSYYSVFFKLIKILFPDIHFEKIIKDFNHKYKKTSKDTSDLHNSVLIEKAPPLSHLPFLKKHLVLLLSVFGVVIFITSGAWILYNNFKNTTSSFRSDLALPADKVFLNRPELITAIKQKLRQGSDLQTLAIVGSGGAGKTTLARQYGRIELEKSVWEINAETRETLNDSYEKLAQALVSNEKDEKIIKGLQAITDPVEKEDRLIQFVRERLRANSNWLLIFDNVELFSDIQKHFPHDPTTWGKGKVILTTRNVNIENNKYVHDILFIGELSSQQKFHLFMAIMNHDSQPIITSDQLKSTKLFLEKIPPFPLDISIAACYLKSTNISYETYLENLMQFNKNFMITQENILKNVSDYVKTRQGIITLSLSKIIKTNKEFLNLLLLMTLFDSQNIQIDILKKFSKDDIVASFIFNLKKYSLLTINPSDRKSLALHRSTQAISLFYLIQELNLIRNNSFITALSKQLEDYMDEVILQESTDKMKPLIRHVHIFLSHKNLLNNKIIGILEGNLGIIHFYLANSQKAKFYLEESLKKLKNLYNQNPNKIALFMGYLGNVIRDLGDYKKSKLILEECLSIYENYPQKDIFRHACFLAYLGIIERIIGNYEKAKSLFERGLNAYKKYFAENENYPAWVSGQLGIIDRELGNYKKSQETLEKSMAMFKNHRSVNHFDIAWVLEHLGPVYMYLGDYVKAKNMLQQSLKICSLHLPDQQGYTWLTSCISSTTSADGKKIKNLFNEVLQNYKIHFIENYIYVAWILHQLANVHAKLNHYELARAMLEQCIIIYQRNYGYEHIETALVVIDLASVYLLENQLTLAEKLSLKAFAVLYKECPSRAFICLDILSEIYLKKSREANDKRNREQSLKFKTQAIAYLKHAIDILNTHFPSDSPHIIRLQTKLTSLMK